MSVTFSKTHRDLYDTKEKYGRVFPGSSTYRTSHCGRFLAVRSEWELPKSTKWALLDSLTGQAHNAGDFAHCGQIAEEIRLAEEKKRFAKRDMSALVFLDSRGREVVVNVVVDVARLESYLGDTVARIDSAMADRITIKVSVVGGKS